MKEHCHEPLKKQPKLRGLLVDKDDSVQIILPKNKKYAAVK
jgi:hypothetical protein